jgi:IS30 family transposase
LDEFVETTGYHRVYAARVLRGHGKRVEFEPGVVLEGSVRAKKRRVRPCEYGPEVVKALKKVWRVMDYVCGKRLAAALPEVVPRLVRCGEFKVSRAVQDKLMRISAATIDRALAAERRKYALKGRGRTKPGTLLKHQIPVRTFAQWNDAEPGFLEVDLVAHDGGSSHGEYCQILDATDVATGWSEQIAVPTKAQCWVFQALKEIRRRLPFELRGLDSDNGSEFINHQLTKYCTQEKLTFTRSRASRKNDNCFVEQKNWSIVRRYSGYGRYEGDQACRILNELYEVVRDFVNFFLPSAKLIEKVRDGARLTKRYDTPQTPYRRVLASPHVPQVVKRRLKRRYATLNPAALKRDIDRLYKRLVTLTVRARSATAPRPKPAPHHPWRRTFTKRNAG